MRSILLFTLIISQFCWAQDSLSTHFPDTNYVEDQFYATLTYGILTNRPSSISQNNLSYGVSVGFIKDLPINKRRNVAFGIGFGYAANGFYHTLRGLQQNGTIVYEAVPADVTYKRNKTATHVVEFPVEFRWRTSTAENYKFWRIYTGMKFGYVFANTTKFVTDAETFRFTNPDIQKFQYGIHASFGYDTWNFYANYQLSSLHRKGTETTDGEAVTMRPLQVGVIFYVL